MADRIKNQMTEQEIRDGFITPAIGNAGWNLLSQVREEAPITAGRVIVRGSVHARAEPGRADYVLSLKPNIALAIVEAKDNKHSIGSGMQQALVYAEMLDIPFAFSSNGDGFLFHDKTATPHEVVERELTLGDFPSPEALWARYQRWKGLNGDSPHIAAQDFYVQAGFKAARYYQSVAVNRAVQAVARGQRRILLVMATGTGKTYVAFQTMWRLRSAGVAKRILFLADRNILIDQAFINDFKPFGEVMTKVTDRTVDKSYEVYLALYQALAGRTEVSDIYRQFSRDFFDLVVVDECHRGSADAESAWREVLEYFDSAVQIGMTATPKETRYVSNIDYFGEPIYVYSLKQGISDGYLAPFKVVRIDLDKDLTGWRPEYGKVDKHGQPIEDRLYNQRDFDRSLVLEQRTQLVAQLITEFLKGTDRFAKTIVFCEDIDHAERMRQALVNTNGDIAAGNRQYVVRITGDSPYGQVDLDAFADPETRFPVIATTSKLLSTGVDIPTCKVIVLDQRIESTTEFKQIIGRGTRLREDYGKYYFTIMDFRKATELFADPAFDGEPISVYEPEAKPPTDHPPQDDTNDGPAGRTKYYVEDVPVWVVRERVQYYDRNGSLITESLRDYTRQAVLGQFQSLDDFLRMWAAADRKSAVIDELERHGVLFDALADDVGREYDAFDLVCHVAFGAPALTRRERARNVRKRNYFAKYGSVAHQVLDALLEKYSDEGIEDIEDPSVLRVQPLNSFGTPIEIMHAFGGREEYRLAVQELENELYQMPREETA